MLTAVGVETGLFVLLTDLVLPELTYPALVNALRIAFLSSLLSTPRDASFASVKRANDAGVLNSLYLSLLSD